MKTMKKIKFLLLGLVFSLLIVSCTTNDGKTPTPEPPVTSLTEDDLTGISVDISGAKTNFYLGDEFSSEGLKVYQDYTKYINGELLKDQKECTKYYLDSSNLDMTKVGDYIITVIYRRAAIKYTTTYNVKVQSSLLEISGEKYLSGLEVEYQGETDLLLNDEFKFDESLLTIKAHFNQSGEEVEIKDLANSDVTIDYSAIDTSKVGSYMIKYTCTENLTIKGNPYKNEVSSFTIVTVANPVSSIKFESGTLTLPASITALDTSDWKIRITRTKGEPEIVDFSTDLFVLEGITTYFPGKQFATIRLKENQMKTITLVVTVIESTEYDILVGNNLTKYEVEDNKIQLDASGKFFVTNNVTIASRNGKDAYGTIQFGDRITIKGSEQYVEVVMDNPGTIILYVATSGADARDLVIFSPSGEEVETFTTSAVKQEVCEFRLDVAEAGTYKIISPNACYFHGCIIATEKA